MAFSFQQRQCPICRASIPLHQPATIATCGKFACQQQWQIQQAKPRYQCTHCQQFVPHDQYNHQSRVCSSPECSRALLHERLQEERIQRERDFLEKVERVKERLAAQLGRPPESLRVAITPVSTKTLTPLPAERREAFLAHLQGLFAALTAPPPTESSDVSDVPTPSDAEEQAPREPFVQNVGWVGQVCRNCQGHCCFTGGEHAYIKLEALQYQLHKDPDLTPEALYQRYVSYLPEHSLQGSCVYHTQTGCNLPRDLRSEISHIYNCSGLEKLLKAPPLPGQQVLAIASEQIEILRMARFDQEMYEELVLEPEEDKAHSSQYSEDSMPTE